MTEAEMTRRSILDCSTYPCTPYITSYLVPRTRYSRTPKRASYSPFPKHRNLLMSSHSMIGRGPDACEKRKIEWLVGRALYTKHFNRVDICGVRWTA